MTESFVYLDHHAHTPLDPLVRGVLLNAWRDHDVNVHAASSEHALRAVEEARSQIANLLGVNASEVVFTSGATEANNLAILGLASHLAKTGRRRIIVSAGEHSSVLAAARSLEPDFEIVQAPLLPSGEVDFPVLEALVTAETGLISIAAANHEIGTIQPLQLIGQLAATHGILFHTDLAQACGKIPLDLAPVHLASISAHKLYGPLGVGALMVRRPVRRLLRPLLHGGGQEGGLRSGTLPTPLCISFGAACDLARQGLASEGQRLIELRARLLTSLQGAYPAMRVNGRLDGRIPGNLNLCFPGVDGEALVMRLRDRVTVATGSACNAHSLEPSPVLIAIGLSRADAESSLRVGLGRATTEADIDFAAEQIALALHALAAIRTRTFA